MKTGIYIFEDVFGKSCNAISKKEALNIMGVFAKQFKWIETTCGKRIQFDDLDYNVLRSRALYINNVTGVVSAVWKSAKGNKTNAPVAKLLLGLEGITRIHYKDGNKLNLKRENLGCINSQTAHFKQKLSKNNTTGFKGVSWNKFAGKYSAKIKHNDKNIHLGYFFQDTEAAKAYNKKAIELFGKDYANLNQIPKIKQNEKNL